MDEIKEEANILGPKEILNNARAVDLVTDEAFILYAAKADIPEPLPCIPQERVGYRTPNFTHPYKNQLPLRWKNPIDGRVVVVKFLEHLARTNCERHYVARPYQLEIPEFRVPDLEMIQAERLDINPSKRRILREDKSLNIDDLLDFSRGRIRIVDGYGNLRFYANGAMPETRNVLIQVPIEQGHRDESQLYESFLSLPRKTVTFADAVQYSREVLSRITADPFSK